NRHTDIGLRVARVPVGKEVAFVWTLSPFPPLDEAWVKQVQALPPDKQVEEVAAELKRRNPGFDGKMDSEYRGLKFPVIEGGKVKGLNFDTGQVTDLSPIRALPDLRYLRCYGSQASRLTDLSPLRGLSLTCF